MTKRFILYADESDGKGRYYSNFYGGALVDADDLPAIEETLNRSKFELGFGNEIKWVKVTETYLEKYKRIIDAFFDLIETGKIKIRIMFTHNTNVASGLTQEQIEGEYYILYYYFIRFAFGMKYCNLAGREDIALQIFLDNIPDTVDKKVVFRNAILKLNGDPDFQQSRVTIARDAIGEVDSKDHVVLQCLDIVLGSISFRLNDKHKEKPLGARRRGKRTIAKEKLYKHILMRIRRMHSNFNVGVSTGLRPDGEKSNRWKHAYRHWLFIASETTFDKSKVKPK